MRTLLLLLALVAVAGCGVSRATSPAAPAADGETGAELWAANCRRCHALRDPGDYSDSEWRLVMMHMRVRANINESEVRAILAFLTAGE